MPSFSSLGWAGRRFVNSRLMATCGVGVLLLQALGSAQAGEVIRIEAADLPTEAACHTETYPHAPRSLSPDGQYGRLSPALRSAAIAADPIDSLARATLYEYARLTLIRPKRSRIFRSAEAEVMRHFMIGA